MTNHKKRDMNKRKRTKPNKVKQRVGKDPERAVSSDLLMQQASTEKKIKNYDDVGIHYDRKTYNKYIQNLEAQKAASQSNDADLKIQLSNRGKQLFKQIKRSTVEPQYTNTVAVSQFIPSQSTDTVNSNVQTATVATAVTMTSQQRNKELESAYQKAYLNKVSIKAPTMKQVQKYLNRVSKGLISENQINGWLRNSGRSASFEKARRAKEKAQGGVSTRARNPRERKQVINRDLRATAAEARIANAAMDDYYAM